MYAHYVWWQFVVAPLWLARFILTVQEALLQLFSVRLLITTLFAHWRRDQISYRTGSLMSIFHAAALNAISRATGFCVRTTLLMVWALAETVFIVCAIATWIAFILAPVVALVCIIWGITLLLGSI